MSDIVDEFATSLLEIENRGFSLIAVLSEILPAVLCETIGEFMRPRSPRF